MIIRKPLILHLFAALLLCGFALPGFAEEITVEPTRPLKQPRWRSPFSADVENYSRKAPDFPGPFATPLLLDSPVEGFDFTDNSALTGFVFIPADPIVSVGPAHVVNVGNVIIEWRAKSDPDSGLVQQSLQTFFSSIPGPSTPVLPDETLGSFTFDPKCIYDQYSNRFVVVALEQWDVLDLDPSNESRILVAVSKTSDPNAGWWYQVIDSKLMIGPTPVWADFPGLAVDDKAIYITSNVFEFLGFSPASGSRLWIVDKSPLYSGPDQSAVVTVHDPYAAAGISTTTQPAHMWGTPPTGLGTYLVSYSGLTAGGNEFVQVVSVSDPLGSSGGPVFSQQFISVGNIDDTALVLPDAPQADTTATVEVNDRRALNAVWRNNSLYMAATVLPAVGPDAGQTTAHWWQLDTSGGTWTLVQQADVGANDLGPATYTFFPAIMVDCLENIAVGFSASNPLIYCGAYFAAQQITDPSGTMQNTRPLALGTDWYVRTFGGSRNRWGDYSGLALCPVDEAVFWLYNTYACQRGTPLGGEDGRWCTKLGSFRLKATATGVPPTPEIPDVVLEQNFPNPFNPTTSIRFTLRSVEQVSIRVFDASGRLVTTLEEGQRPAGINFVYWNGTNSNGNVVSSGVYYYKLVAGRHEQTRRMVLLK